jgi:DNA-binding CsgD family transcriptional regulator
MNRRVVVPDVGGEEPVVPFVVDGREYVLLPCVEDANVRWGVLTKAERAVVELALAGNGNEDIARLRGKSLRTVRNQLASAYAKLGVGGRVELASRLR